MKTIKILISFVIILSSCSQEPNYKTPVSDIEKVSYSIGVNVATALKSRNDLDTISAMSVAKAFNDVTSKPELPEGLNLTSISYNIPDAVRVEII